MVNWLIRRMIRKSINAKGATICLTPNDPVVSGALNLGVYEREEIQFFVDHFKSGMSFVDVGANLGLYTALAMRGGAGSIQRWRAETQPVKLLVFERSLGYSPKQQRSPLRNGFRTTTTGNRIRPLNTRRRRSTTGRKARVEGGRMKGGSPSPSLGFAALRCASLRSALPPGGQAQRTLAPRAKSTYNQNYPTETSAN
jgi:hypothetical protein